MKKTTFVAGVLFAILSLGFLVKIQNANAGGTGWFSVGEPGFVLPGEDGLLMYSDVYFNSSDDEPYVAYYANNVLGVMRFDGSSWIQVGSTSSPTGDDDPDSITFKFNPYTNEPYVFYMQYPSEEGTVMKFNGSAWETVGAEGFTPGMISDYGTDIAFNPVTHNPYVAFSDRTAEGEDNAELTVMQLNGTTWEKVGDNISVQEDGFYLSLSFDPSTNEPYVAYDDPDGGITVKRFNDSNWATVGSNGFGSEYAESIKIGFSTKNNIPFVAYVDGGNSDIVLMQYADSSWSNVGETNKHTSHTIDLSLSFYPSIDIPYILFVNPSDNIINIIKYSSGEWSVEWPFPDSANSTPYLTFDPDTLEPLVVFENSEGLQVMKHEDFSLDEDQDNHSGKNWKLYKHFKERYKNASKKKDYWEVKSLKKNNLAEFERLRALYIQYKGYGNRYMATLDQKIQDDYKLYKNYRGYKKYRFYKDKVGE